MNDKAEQVGCVQRKFQSELVLKETFQDFVKKDGDVLKQELQEEDLVLEEVGPDRQLVQELEKFLPLSYHVVSVVLLQLRFQHLHLLRARVFTPRWAPYRYKMAVVTNIATADDLSTMSLFWSKDHLSDGAVCQLLRSLPGNSWKKPIFIRLLPKDLHLNMDRIVDALSGGSMVARIALPLVLFTMKNSPPNVPSLPEGYYAGSLEERHGKKVLTGWAGDFSENVENFSRILEHLPTVGIFKPSLKATPETTNGIENHVKGHTFDESIAEIASLKPKESKNNIFNSSCSGESSGESSGELNDPSDVSMDPTVNGCIACASDETTQSPDDLVGWCLLKHGADIGMTYTTKGHRNLGLAKAATLEMARRALHEKVNAFIMSTEPNEVSIRMHTKLGFEEHSTSIALMYAPEEYSVDHISKTIRC